MQSFKDDEMYHIKIYNSKYIYQSEQQQHQVLFMGKFIM